MTGWAWESNLNLDLVEKVMFYDFYHGKSPWKTIPFSKHLKQIQAKHVPKNFIFKWSRSRLRYEQKSIQNLLTRKACRGAYAHFKFIGYISYTIFSIRNITYMHLLSLCELRPFRNAVVQTIQPLFFEKKVASGTLRACSTWRRHRASPKNVSWSAMVSSSDQVTRVPGDEFISIYSDLSRGHLKW